MTRTHTTAVTRGSGFLERFLARRRAAMADRLIPRDLRHGRLLDVGCGTYPYFLSRIEFAEKLGVDKVVKQSGRVEFGHAGSADLEAVAVDADDRLPFDDEHFDAVTMLAVFEHIRRERLVLLLNEVHRVLKPGGCYIMTTPTGWTAPVLGLLSAVGAVSGEEIGEHQDAYSRGRIRQIMGQTPFDPQRTRYGTFELGMNHWMVARR